MSKSASESKSLNPDSPSSGLQKPEYEFNGYWEQLSPEEIAAGKHRTMVGGFWEEIGSLQFEFMKTRGLLPEHQFVDIGCGAMRGGIYFVRYLNQGNYFGLDRNASLIQAGRLELDSVSLSDKLPNLLVNEQFELSLFETRFDYALALSVFTHLFMNHIMRCLIEVNRVLKPGGQFYATFFQSPHSGFLSPIHHTPGGITTYYDRDPFHYSFLEMENLAKIANLDVELIEEWTHPRNQKMLCFTKSPFNE